MRASHLGATIQPTLLRGLTHAEVLRVRMWPPLAGGLSAAYRIEKWNIFSWPSVFKCLRRKEEKATSVL